MVHQRREGKGASREAFFSQKEIAFLIKALDVIEGEELLLKNICSRLGDSVLPNPGLKQLLSDKGLADYSTKLMAFISNKRKELTKLKTKLYTIEEHLTGMNDSEAVRALLDELDKGKI